MSDYRILPAGDAALVVDFGDRIERALNNRVLALAQAIAEDHAEGVLETVPTFRSLMIYYQPERIAYSRLVERVSEWMIESANVSYPSRLWRVPVCYDPSVAPDMLEVAERLGLSPGEIAERHAAITHHVYMLGFLPGQPYLGDLPMELALPRRASPRGKVAAGSVGVAMTMTCVFPRETPCGLNVIGRTPAPLWDPLRAEGWRLAPGDKVIFEPITLEAFEALSRPAREGWLQMRHEFGDSEVVS